MANKLIVIFLSLLTVFVFLLIFSYLPKEIGDPFIFEIKKGEGVEEILANLEKNNLIFSKIIFKFYGFLTLKAHRFLPGFYLIEGPISAAQLVDLFSKGPTQISVVIRPGMTVREIDDKLSSLKIIKKGELAQLKITKELKDKFPFLPENRKEAFSSFEGFLLPDTYKFYLYSSPETVVEKFLTNFLKKTKGLFKDLTFLSDNDKLFKILILASFLEKEVPDYSERKIVAGILEKRLKKGMLLQVDASVLYAKCQGRYNCLLLKKDFEIDSPYNNYLYKGLPPTPIANPSISAIKAVLEKEDSDYWYYLSDPKTKKTIFSKTFDEHNKNRVKYLLRR